MRFVRTPVAKLPGELPLPGGRTTRPVKAADVVYRDGRIRGVVDWVPTPRRLHEVPDWAPG